MLTAIFLAAFASCVAADAAPGFVQPGKCAELPIQNNFDLRKYAGRWYQSHAIPNPFEPGTSCLHAYFDYSETLYGFHVSSAGLGAENDYLKLEFDVYPVKEFPAAHMLLDGPTMIAAPFEVVETDYKSYSCVYSCNSMGGYRAEFGFVFTRSLANAGPAAERCAAVFNKNGVEFSRFEPISHPKDCVYRA
uniref:Crustacyanin-A2 n=1 Tax=Panulirus cygnus TaxID=150421 RepID=B8Y904_9EUCA|nr:crustacyanin-A2 precursor [Panulirus cygnus]